MLNEPLELVSSQQRKTRTSCSPFQKVHMFAFNHRLKLCLISVIPFCKGKTTKSKFPHHATRFPSQIPLSQQLDLIFIYIQSKFCWVCKFPNYSMLAFLKSKKWAINRKTHNTLFRRKHTEVYQAHQTSTLSWQAGSVVGSQNLRKLLKFFSVETY